MANMAIVQTDYSSEKPAWEKVELVRTEKPQEVRAGHVLIKVRLRPIKRSDLLYLNSNHFRSKNPAAICGNEAVGIVDSVGKGVEKFQIGQRVVPFIYSRFLLTGNGSWQEYMEVPESEVFPIPDDVSDEIACQLYGNPFTAFLFFEKLQIPKGDYLLQTASNGAIGSLGMTLGSLCCVKGLPAISHQSEFGLYLLRFRMIIQLAKRFGVKTINLVRRDDMNEELNSLGADEVINYTAEDVVERVKDITGGKLAYAAVDAVLGRLTKVVASSVRKNGELYLYGFLSGSEVTFNVFDLGFSSAGGRNIQVTYFFLPDYMTTPEEYSRIGNQVIKFYQDKILVDLDVDSYTKFTFDNWKTAMKMGQEARGGKKVLFATP